MAFLFKEGLPIFGIVSPPEFFLGKFWYPTYEPPDFGILPLIMGSLIVTVGAIIIAVPLGVATGIYLSEVAHPRLKEILKPIIELLAGVPSVVYGFFGLVVVAPWIQGIFDLPIGLTALTASLMLGIMASPTIISLSEDALSSVPSSFREASLALGASKWYTVYRAILPPALPGILTGSILGVGRAAGETAPIIFTAACFYTPRLPHSIFDQVMALPFHLYVLASEGTHFEKTLPLQYGTALVLLALVLGINLLAIVLRIKLRKKLRW